MDFYLEIIAVLTGVFSVWLAKKENIYLYPVGIFSVVAWLYLCWVGQIYSQAIINLFFFIMNVYGWYNWNRKDDNNNKEIHIKFNSLKENFFYIIIALILTFIIFKILSNTEVDNYNQYYILIESFITSLNFIAMWLMAWKRVDNWVLWIIGDFFCIPLYFFKGYYISTAQFLIFIIIAFLGYFEWKKKALKSQNIL